MTFTRISLLPSIPLYVFPYFGPKWAHLFSISDIVVVIVYGISIIYYCWLRRTEEMNKRNPNKKSELMMGRRILNDKSILPCFLFIFPLFLSSSFSFVLFLSLFHFHSCSLFLLFFFLSYSSLYVFSLFIRSPSLPLTFFCFYFYLSPTFLFSLFDSFSASSLSLSSLL